MKKLVLFLFLISGLSIAETPDSTNVETVIKNPVKKNVRIERDYTPKWYEMITNIPEDLVTFYHEDITLEKLPLYAVIAGMTAQLIYIDYDTWQAGKKFYEKSQVHRNFSDFFVSFGDGKSQFAFAAVFAAQGLIWNNNKSLRVASQIVEAVLVSGGVVQVLKHITGRESPFVSTERNGAWRFFPNQIDYHKHVPHYDAFPSGHLTTSIAAFTVIAENYPDQKWIMPLSAVLSAGIAVGMVNAGIHWYSDYPLAIFLGYTFGKIVAARSYEPENETVLRNVGVAPYVSPFGSGISLSYKIK